VVVYALPKSEGALSFPDGVRVKLSSVPVKPGFLATVKTCNYLPNVLMKKESVDHSVDFVISLDEQGFLAEGATENVGIVTPEGELLMPPPERVLAGTTAKRALELAQRLVGEGVLKRAAYAPISLEQVRSAAEMHIYGTTPNVTPVVEFDGAPVGTGEAGPIARRLFDWLREEMIPESPRLTQVFE
jgi:branched-chain amino acid aminotransferase